MCMYVCMYAWMYVSFLHIYIYMLSGSNICLIFQAGRGSQRDL